MTLYRSIIGPVADLMVTFAPQTEFAIDKADVEIRAPYLLPIRLDGAALRARTVQQGPGAARRARQAISGSC